MKPIYDDGEFRKYPPEHGRDQWGNVIATQVCEELDPESERWEPFLVSQILMAGGKNV